MQATSKASGKFGVARMKCVTKCVNSFWKGLVAADTDCFLPCADPFTASCVQKAEDKFKATIMKKCTLGRVPACSTPGCYQAGDCSATGFPRSGRRSWEISSTRSLPGSSASERGAFLLEMRCQTTASEGDPRSTSGKIDRCFDKCMGLALKGLTTFPDCIPAGADPPDDPVTAACLARLAGTPSTRSITTAIRPPASPTTRAGRPTRTAPDGPTTSSWASSPTSRPSTAPRRAAPSSTESRAELAAGGVALPASARAGRRERVPRVVEYDEGAELLSARLDEAELRGDRRVRALGRQTLDRVDGPFALAALAFDRAPRGSAEFPVVRLWSSQSPVGSVPNVVLK